MIDKNTALILYTQAGQLAMDVVKAILYSENEDYIKSRIEKLKIFVATEL